MDLSRELLAAIGEVAVDAASLEYAIAHLVVARTGADEAESWDLVTNSSELRKKLKRLATAEPDWRELRQVYDAVEALMRDRNKVVHSVIVEVLSEAGDEGDIEFWHPMSRAEIPVAVHTVEELAFGLRRCFKRAVELIPEARLRRTNSP